MRNDDTREFWHWVKLMLMLLVILLVVGFFTNWFGLITERPMLKYKEETRAQTYDSSRQYQQGTNRDIARYCEQMRDAPSASSKKAMAALIRSQVSTYDGPLSDDDKDCVSEAKGL